MRTSPSAPLYASGAGSRCIGLPPRYEVERGLGAGNASGAKAGLISSDAGHGDYF
ncbi:MAG: hypothetical protein ACYDBJ_19325 [Aggregatilineales bacterium]